MADTRIDIWCKNAGRSRGLPVDVAMEELEIGSNKTIVDWNQFCRDVPVTYFANYPVRLGGPGRVVEIDESLNARRKYERGRIVPQQWIFGGWERDTKCGFRITTFGCKSLMKCTLSTTDSVPGLITTAIFITTHLESIICLFVYIFLTCVQFIISLFI